MAIFHYVMYVLEMSLPSTLLAVFFYNKWKLNPHCSFIMLEEICLPIQKGNFLKSITEIAKPWSGHNLGQQCQNIWCIWTVDSGFEFNSLHFQLTIQYVNHQVEAIDKDLFLGLLVILVLVLGSFKDSIRKGWSSSSIGAYVVWINTATRMNLIY